MEVTVPSSSSSTSSESSLSPLHSSSPYHLSSVDHRLVTVAHSARKRSSTSLFKNLLLFLWQAVIWKNNNTLPKTSRKRIVGELKETATENETDVTTQLDLPRKRRRIVPTDPDISKPITADLAVPETDLFFDATPWILSAAPSPRECHGRFTLPLLVMEPATPHCDTSSFIKLYMDRLVAAEHAQSAVDLLTRNSGNNVVNLLVATLRSSDSLDELDATVDLLLDMKLAEEAHHQARAEFDHSQLSRNLVQAMQRGLQDYQQDNHPDSTKELSLAQLLTKCCTLITALTFHHASNKTAFIQANGVTVIVQAMNCFAYDTYLQQAACSALYNLLKLPCYHDQIISSTSNCDQSTGNATGNSVLAALIAALSRHADNDCIQRDACNSLKLLAQSSFKNKQRIMDGNGLVELALAQKRARAQDNRLAVERAATRALQCCLCDDAAKAAATEANGNHKT